MKTLFLMVSCLAILASCNNIERLDSNENDLSRIVQSAIEQYETDYASKYLRVKKENTVLLGYKTVNLTNEDRATLRWFTKKFARELKNERGLFISPDSMFYRIYFPLHTAIISNASKLINADTLGNVKIKKETRSVQAVRVVGRLRSSTIRGCGSNIIVGDTIFLKNELKPITLRKGICVFDMGKACLTRGYPGNEDPTDPGEGVPCVENHGGMNCSDAFRLWGDRCVQHHEWCMDYNGYETDCIKDGRYWKFIGSDCFHAMVKGECWNEIMK